MTELEGAYTSEMGCISSYADAKHDFLGEVFSGVGALEKIQDFVKENIPDVECEKRMNEDGFLKKYILNDTIPEVVSKMKELFHQDNTALRSKIFNDNINEKYIIHTIHRPQHSTDYPFSKIQQALNSSSVLEDIFIVCDVAYANVREDIKQINNRENNENTQKFYWVQNAQTLYDPAGKTAWHTGKDLGFQDEISKFIFCWEDANKKLVTHFPRWMKSDKPVEYNNPVFYPEKLLYTNKDLYLTIKAVKDQKAPAGSQYDNYYNHEAILLITDPDNPRKFAYADKVLSSRGTGQLKQSELLGYRKKGEDLNLFVKILNKSLNDKISEDFLKILIDYNSYYQILAKKVGDAGQSLSCCKKKFILQQFNNRKLGINSKKQLIDKTNVEPLESNGKHMFVSYDRIAIGCALNYNCPIVLQNSEEGFILYIRKDLINIDNQATLILSAKTITKYDIQPISSTTSTFADIELFSENIKLFMDNIQKNKIFLQEIALPYVTADQDLNEQLLRDEDEKYQLLLTKYFINIPVFELVNLLPTKFVKLDYIGKLNEIPISLYNLINDEIKIFVTDVLNTLKDELELDVNSEIKNLFDINFISFDIAIIIDNFDITNGDSALDNITGFFGSLLQILENYYKTKPKKDGDPAKTPKGKIIYPITYPVKEEKLKIIKIGGIINSVFNYINSYFKEIEKANNVMKKIMDLWSPGGIPLLKHRNPNSANPDIDYLTTKNLPRGFSIKNGCVPFYSLAPDRFRMSRSCDFLTKSESLFYIDSVVFPVINSIRTDIFVSEKNHFARSIYDIVKNVSDLGNGTPYSQSIVSEALNTLESNSLFNTIAKQSESESVNESESLTELVEYESSEPSTETSLSSDDISQTSAETSLSSDDISQTSAETSQLNEIELPDVIPVDEEDIPNSVEETAPRYNEYILRSKNFLIENPDPNLSGEMNNFITSLQTNQLFEWINIQLGNPTDTIIDIGEIQKTSLEIQIFLKGFFGIITLIHYNKIRNNLKTIPTIIKTRSGGIFEPQKVLFSQFTEITKELFFNDTVSFIQGLISLKRTKSSLRNARLKKLEIAYKDSVPEYQNYLDLYNNNEIEELKSILDSINEFQGYFEDDEDETDPDEYSNEYLSINPFFGIIERNKVSFDYKNLEGEYFGYNANEFNFNMMLYCYFDYKMNKESEYSEYADLFNQLFSDTNLFTQRRGGSNNVSELELPENVSNIVNYFFTYDLGSTSKYMKTALEILLNPPKIDVLKKLRDILSLNETQQTKKKELFGELNENYKILYDIYPAIITYDESIHSVKIPTITSIDIKQEPSLKIQMKEPNKIANEKESPITPINTQINPLLPTMGGGKLLRGKTHHKKTTKSKIIKRTKKYRKINKRNNRKTKRRIRKTRKY
jgi:hypothetical protein